MFSFFTYTEAQLAKDIIRICRQLMPDEQFQYHPDEHTVTCTQADIYLSNILGHVKNIPEKQRHKFIKSFLHSALIQHEISYENSSHRLIPRIKSTAEFMTWSTHLSLDSYNEWPHLQLTEHFVYLVGLTHETSIHSIMKTDLEQMGLSFEEALKHATANLYRLEDKPFVEIESGLFSIDSNDGQNSARIMLVDEITSLAIKGSPVAFLPTAEELFICGSEDVERLNHLAPRCQALQMEKQPLCLHPIVLHEGKWQDFYPPKTTEYAPIHNLHQIERTIQYSDQRTELEHEVVTQNNNDIYIATQSLLEREDSPFFFSVCTWTEGTHTYLPLADQVHFVANISDSQLGVLGVLSWQDTIKHFGNLMKPLGKFPERYEVTSFPDKNTLLTLIAKC